MTKVKKTALVLGGGGSRGSYQIGVWQALREMDIDIDIVTGTSVGAINGAMVIQDEFDLSLSLWKELETNKILDVGLDRKDEAPLKKLLNQYIDEKIVRKSKVDYGLVTVELPGLNPHHLYKDNIPEGKLIDFILASSALFPAIKYQDIDNIKYVDGGYSDNLPVDMALKKGATHVVAVDLDTAGIVRKKPLEQTEHLILIHCKWDLGSILVFDKNTAKRNIRLGYLDALKAFGFYDGCYYCFLKGEFNNNDLESAELAAKIFELDPCILYTKASFNDKLKDKVKTYRSEIEQELRDFQTSIKKRRLFKKRNLIKLLKKVNERTLCIIIADYLKANCDTPNSFVAKTMNAVFHEESQAARYLLSHLEIFDNRSL